MNYDYDTPCSFCRKPTSRVEHMISGGGVWICSECVELAVEVLEQKRERVKRTRRVKNFARLLRDS